MREEQAPQIGFARDSDEEEKKELVDQTTSSLTLGERQRSDEVKPRKMTLMVSAFSVDGSGSSEEKNALELAKKKRY